MVIFQKPNKSAAGWISAGFAYVLGSSAVKRATFIPFVSSLGVWSYGEATKGASKFRKSLGLLGLGATALVVLSNWRTIKK